MRLIVGKAPLKRILKWSRRGLFACAVLLLGYCGFALVDARIFQRRESRDLDRLLRDRSTSNQGKAQSESSAAPEAASAVADGLIGRIEIPRLLLSVVVVEGIGRIVLRRAVGHIPGTALPGERGNVGI